ncbi:MAG: serine hydroxymethyltransferase [Planctomycetota bacterium]
MDSQLRLTDAETFALLQAERQRQNDSLCLIASENHCSRAVREACASVITDKYAEGYPGARYYGGCEVADRIETLAQQRACRLFGAEFANVQPHSGTTANVTTLAALARPGEPILGMALNAGGHLSHGFKVSHTGQFFAAKQYGVQPDSGLIDLDQVREMAREHRPKVLIAGASSYPRALPYAEMRAIADEVGAVLLADIAHPAGLMAAGVMPSPVGIADVVTMTTHKTLRGPRGGMILSRSKDLAEKIDKSVFPGGQGGPLMHQIAGKAVAFGEALAPSFAEYQRRVLANAQRLAQRLMERGLPVVTGGTDCHMVVVSLVGRDVTGAEVEQRSLAAGISLNKNMVPGDPRSPRVTSGIRIGTAAATSRGLGTAEMDQVADILVSLIEGAAPEGFRARVADLCQRFPPPA